MKRYRFFAFILLCTSLVCKLTAQGYEAPDGSRFEASSVYYLTLHDAAGASINQDFAQTAGAIGAFVGDELRGVSTLLPVAQSGQTVFRLRVWGDENDASQVVFRLFADGLEYQLGSMPFGRGEDVTYGQPAAPNVLTLSPVTGMSITPATVTVAIGGTAYVKASLLPANHSELVSTVTYTYSAGTPAGIFSVSETGLITGLAEGEAQLNAAAIVNGQQRFTATAQVVVSSSAEPLQFAFASSAFTLSKLHDAPITLTANQAFVPEWVELVFSRAANDEPVATATMADDSGLNWTARGHYVGQHTCTLRYNGEQHQEATCQVNIPAEFTFMQGWDWISFYAIGPTGELPLRQDNQWLPTLRLDNDNIVFEIRSQQAVLRYDPQYGYFGTLEAFRPADGAYKIFNEYADENALRMVINMGYEGLLKGDALPRPMAHRGYTWTTYPHELDHSLAALTPYLNTSAEMGDMIIGRTGFAEFNGSEWIADDDFAFEAGQGYIYYTESDTLKAINWGPETLKPDGEQAGEAEPQGARRHTRSAASSGQWQYNPRQYPETMAIVATLADGAHDPAALRNVSIGAYVDDECRGEGKLTSNGQWHITLTGQAGEEVTLRLYDALTGTTSQMGQKLTFATRAGSWQSPVALSLQPSAVGPSASDAVYDLQGRRLSQCPQRGIYIINGKKVIK